MLARRFLLRMGMAVRTTELGRRVGRQVTIGATQVRVRAGNRERMVERRTLPRGRARAVTGGAIGAKPRRDVVRIRGLLIVGQVTRSAVRVQSGKDTSPVACAAVCRRMRPC